MKFTVIKNEVLIPLLKITITIIVLIVVYSVIIYGVWNTTVVGLCDNLNKMSRSGAALLSAVYLAFNSLLRLSNSTNKE